VASGVAMAVAPADVASDRDFLSSVIGVVAAVEGEAAQSGELAPSTVQPGVVGGSKNRGRYLWWRNQYKICPARFKAAGICRTPARRV